MHRNLIFHHQLPHTSSFRKKLIRTCVSVVLTKSSLVLKKNLMRKTGNMNRTYSGNMDSQKGKRIHRIKLKIARRLHLQHRYLFFQKSDVFVLHHQLVSQFLDGQHFVFFDIVQFVQTVDFFQQFCSGWTLIEINIYKQFYQSRLENERRRTIF